MKIYDLVMDLLVRFPQLRDSDKKLIWSVWYKQGLCQNGSLTKEQFVNDAESPETIRRTRQKVQEKHPELSSSPLIQEMKDKKEQKKGNFVYQEEIGYTTEGLTKKFEIMREALQKKGIIVKQAQE